MSVRFNNERFFGEFSAPPVTSENDTCDVCNGPVDSVREAFHVSPATYAEENDDSREVRCPGCATDAWLAYLQERHRDDARENT